MPRKPHDENLFEESTMTLGEHLEELRACLFKCVIGLAFGFIIGLFVGAPVVSIIQKPLTLALTDYYKKQSLEKISRNPKQESATENFALVQEDQLVVEEVYVDSDELLRKLGAEYPNQFKGVSIPPKPSGSELRKKDLIPLRLWHNIEDDSRIRSKSLNAQEAFIIYVKASLLVGVMIASPWIFYQIWAFVAAGLYRNEKRYVHVFLPFSLGLFFLGAAVAFFFVFKPVLAFLFSFNSWLGIDPDPRISEWLGFVLLLPLGFGISFQLPLVMLFLERIGVFTTEAYTSQWRIAILVIFVLAMLLTPADPTSMLLMACPLTILYFGGILLCHFMPRSKSPYRD